jgi:hypothetical protein
MNVIVPAPNYLHAYVKRNQQEKPSTQSVIFKNQKSQTVEPFKGRNLNSTK